MKDERVITQFGRVPVQRVLWSAIFAGTFFAFGIMLILGLFGLAAGAVASSTQGAAQGVNLWAGIWSIVTAFVAFLGGGWLAAKASDSPTRRDGRLHGIVTWALGTSGLLYFAVNGTERMAGILASMTGNLGAAALTPGSVETVTVGIALGAAVWAVVVTISGLIGALIGGHAGSHPDRELAAAQPIRRVA